jgi:hypothetical protein
MECSGLSLYFSSNLFFCSSQKSGNCTPIIIRVINDFLFFYFRSKRSLFHADTQEKGKIFNSVPPVTPVAKEPVAPKIEEKKIIDDTDDDWGAVPAFLRRAKK